MITIAGAIFDIDGTLLDSVDLHAEAWRLAFRDFGKIIPARIIRTQIGKGGDQLLPVFLGPDECRAFGEQLTEHRGEVWKSRFMSQVKPFPGVRGLFESLHGRGIRPALASSCKKDELEHYKKLLKIEDLVEADASADDAARSKPHPDIFEAAIRRAGVPAERSVAIGDTPYDAEASRKAGLTAVGVLCGGFPAETLKGAGCRVIYRNPSDLRAQMDGWVCISAKLK